MASQNVLPLRHPSAGSVRYFEPEEIPLQLAARRGLRRDIELMWALEMGLPALPLNPDLHPFYTPAVLARQLATFRYEDAAFVLLAERTGLKPVWLTYTGDKFSTESSLKRSYMHPIFLEGIGKRNGGLMLRKHRLADIPSAAGRRLDEINTACGRTLVQYHHEHQDRVYPGATRVDNTDWIRQLRAPSAKEYYGAYLSMFMAHAVLFEDYHGGESGAALDGFTANVFQPAYDKLYRDYGVHPLIVRMPWWPELQYYPRDSNWREHGVRLV